MDIHHQPLVSVLMPCYNVEEFVEESMMSILNQTYRNIEILAINDCSKDNTLQILNKLASKDSRIKVISNQENLKLITTLNKGITLCAGEYIARMDADDISLPMRIEKEVEFLEKHKDHDIVSTQFNVFRSGKPNKLSLHHNPLLDQELRAYLLLKSGICHPAVMMRKRVFTELGLKFEKEYLHVEDFALWSEAIYKTKLGNLPDALLLYRVHSNQVSSQFEDLQRENKKKIFKIHCKQLGLPEDGDFLDVYASVAESNPSQSSFSYLDKCEKFMLDLIELNNKKSFCDGVFLKQMLSIHWLRVCANSQLGLTTLAYLKKSSLYNKELYSVRDFAVLYTKCIFKIKYKKSFVYKMLLQ